jgi:diaminohydroxyphosphoribosylaminopyrimidine deaminase/5-amino-6-(5-phosphoribosylamino)uracil reductase
MSAASSDLDHPMMRRAIRLAMNGRGRVEPNPMVAAVIVKDGRVIGEGFHAHYGGPHAEPTALANLTESAQGATAYVTVEPCCHTNKKTPPCVPALINAGVARVVVGCVDPNPAVNGQGLDQLRAAGIAVECNVLEDAAKQLLAPFIARVVYDRPYVTLKWAETADGKIAGAGGKRLQISNPTSSTVVHELRSRSDAIMVGVNTVITDDPMLTPRDVPPTERRLIRVVLDSRLRMPLSSKLVRTARQTRTFAYFDTRLADAERDRVRALRDAGVEPVFADRQSSGLNLEQVLVSLGGFDVTHVLVEPGPTLAENFLIRQNLVDRVWIIHSPTKVNDPTAPPGVGLPSSFIKTGELDLAGDRLIEYLNPLSPVFFAAEPSADLVLAGAR